MRAVERVAILIAAVLVLAISLGLWGYLAAWYSPGAVVTQIESMAGSGDLYIVAILLTALGIGFLFLAIAGPAKPKAVITEGTLGQVRVSTQAIDALVKQAASEIRGVREVETELSVDKLGFRVGLKLLVASDLSIPALTEQVQEAVNSYLDRTLGTSPQQINVLVRNIATSRGKVV